MTNNIQVTINALLLKWHEPKEAEEITRAICAQLNIVLKRDVRETIQRLSERELQDMGYVKAS